MQTTINPSQSIGHEAFDFLYGSFSIISRVEVQLSHPVFHSGSLLAKQVVVGELLLLSIRLLDPNRFEPE